MIVTEEFKRGMSTLFSLAVRELITIGSEIVDKVIIGTSSWSELFSKHDFFHKYRYYLQIIASTGNADLQLKWYVFITGDDFP